MPHQATTGQPAGNLAEAHCKDRNEPPEAEPPSVDDLQAMLEDVVSLRDQPGRLNTRIRSKRERWCSWCNSPRPRIERSASRISSDECGNHQMHSADDESLSMRGRVVTGIPTTPIHRVQSRIIVEVGLLSAGKDFAACCKLRPEPCWLKSNTSSLSGRPLWWFALRQLGKSSSARRTYRIRRPHSQLAGTPITSKLCIDERIAIDATGFIAPALRHPFSVPSA